MAETEPLESDVVAVFDDFWADIVCPDGAWDFDQVKRELHDYHTCITEVPKVYCAVTGGMLSKPNYDAAVVIDAHNEQCDFKRWYDELYVAAEALVDVLYEDGEWPRTPAGRVADAFEALAKML